MQLMAAEDRKHAELTARLVAAAVAESDVREAEKTQPRIASNKARVLQIAKRTHKASEAKLISSTALARENLLSIDTVLAQSVIRSLNRKIAAQNSAEVRGWLEVPSAGSSVEASGPKLTVNVARSPRNDNDIDSDSDRRLHRRGVTHQSSVRDRLASSRANVTFPAATANLL